MLSSLYNTNTAPPTTNPTDSPTTDSPTTSPLKSPAPTPCTVEGTGQPGVPLQVDITTDNYPGETSWTLANTCGTSTQVGARLQGYYGTATTLYTDNYCVDGNAAFEFVINDSYGDGKSLSLVTILILIP